MKRLLLASLVIGSLSAPVLCAAASDTDTISQGSYVLGYHIGQGFKDKSIPVDTKQFSKGFSDAVTGTSPSMTEAQQQMAMEQYQTLVSKQMQKTQGAAAETNLKAGQAFLDKTAKETGVKSLPGGLLYKVITEGTGPMPKATDTVTVNYEGTLIDGTVFDSSYQRKQPATFKLNQVIKGWTEGVQHMPVGSTWMFYIPADLAYGKLGTPGGPIGPNSALIFKVELLQIK
jgi:FKBP-type peptidyl-prolyl cis-trans isomerase FklB